MRRFCSIELLRLATRLTRREAAEAIGLVAAPAQATASKISMHLRKTGLDGLFIERLRGLADELDAQADRIDYGRRRRMLLDFSEVPWADWTRISAASGMSPEWPHRRNRNAAIWLWTELTCGDFRLAPGLCDRPTHARAAYLLFVKRTLPRLEVELRHFGDGLLAAAA